MLYKLHNMFACVFFAIIATAAASGLQAQLATAILATVPQECTYHGKTYPLGHSFHPSPCEHCTCTQMGRVMCAIADCFFTPCVNPIHDPNKCCPVCPDGPNCLYGKTIIKAGTVYKPDNYTTCQCDGGVHFVNGRDAICATVAH